MFARVRAGPGDDVPAEGAVVAQECGDAAAVAELHQQAQAALPPLGRPVPGPRYGWCARVASRGSWRSDAAALVDNDAVVVVCGEAVVADAMTLLSHVVVYWEAVLVVCNEAIVVVHGDAVVGSIRICFCGRIR